MTKLLQRSLTLACILFVTNFGHAQPVITEFYLMKEAIKVDLTDKKILKTINAKGILELTWNTSSSMLAVTYDPKMTESREVAKTIQEVLGMGGASMSKNTSQSK